MIYDHPPPIVAPEQLYLAKKRRHRHSETETPSPQHYGTGLVIGAIILLDDGKTPCQIVTLEPEPLCVPVSPPPK